MLGIFYQFSQIKFQFCYSLIEIHKYLKSNSLTYAIHSLHAHILQTNELNFQAQYYKRYKALNL